MIENKLYPLAEEYSADKRRKYRVRPTGEFRMPLRGEWYLSGAIVEGYQAPNDLSIDFHIGRLVEVEEVTIIREKA